MGMYDSITVLHPAFKCSEGHDLSEREWQTKDLDEALYHFTLHEDGKLVRSPAPEDEEWPPDSPVNGVVEIYTDCHECPAWVQKGTGNVCPAGVDYEVTFENGRMTGYKRTSEPTPEQQAAELKQPWMQGAVGPLSYEEAYDLSSAYHLCVYGKPDHPQHANWEATCQVYGVNWREWHEYIEAKRAETRKKYGLD